ncbi:MAG: BT4734/BF3469 family protein [Candidatus Omnitrophica bacterium]|nr:BT4734/BF3469 family protein [Candidatus Omnitrophota bacterium]
MITVQKNVKDKVCSYAELNSVIEKIKTGGNLKQKILELRSLSDVEYKKRKDEMAVIVFQGKFSERNKSSLIESSGLMILDFDSTEPDFKKQLKKLPYVYIAFDSLSGRGVKALVKIPNVKSDEEYKQYWVALSKEVEKTLSHPIDQSGKDISRACFFSYDPDIYININAEVWNKKIVKENQPPVQNPKYVKTDYKKAKIALDYIRYSQVGERHTRILKASILMGGYVVAGLILESEAIRLLEQEAFLVDKDDFQTNKKAISDGILHGKQSPVYDEMEREITTEEKYGKLYYTLTDVEKEIDEKYEKGISRGYYVGWNVMHDFYTLKLGATTYLYGSPFCGKTQLWNEILINCSKFYQMRHALFSPETGGADDVYIDLLETYVGKDFYNDYGNQMTVAERNEGKKFLDKYFIILDPSDNLITIDDFYSYVDIIERKYNTKIHTTTIDPWNELKHDFADTGRQDIYLEWTLGKIRQNAKINNRHNAIITHITSQQKIKDKQTDKMYYPAADFREVAGGQSWARKGMNMLSLWRPPEDYLIDETPCPANGSIINVQKVKPKGVGKKGSFMLLYDARQHRFYENYMGHKLYSSPADGKAEQVQQIFAQLPVEKESEFPF